jgi:hypothetical protein
MDWTTVAAALAGGLIGILAELMGRRSARRQALEQRSLEIEDRRIQHEHELAEAEQKERRERSGEAAQAIINTIRDNPVPILDPEGLALQDQEIIKRAWNIWSTLYSYSPSIGDPELRNKVQQAEQVLDMATTPNVSLNIPLREVVFIVRNHLYLWLGSWLRGEELPAETSDWQRVLKGLENAQEQWRSWLAQEGYEIRPYL